MTVSVTAACGAETSNLTPEPKPLIRANSFLSPFVWPRTKALKEATTNKTLRIEGRWVIFFMQKPSLIGKVPIHQEWVKDSLTRQRTLGVRGRSRTVAY